jgi:uncharacterized protein YciI
MSTFAVTTAKGPRWDDTRGIREQPFFGDHAAFMDELVADGVIILGGPIGGDDADVIALLAVEAPDEAAARAIFSADPWLKHQVFRLKEIRAWTIWLDGRRPG